MPTRLSIGNFSGKVNNTKASVKDDGLPAAPPVVTRDPPVPAEGTPTGFEAGGAKMLVPNPQLNSLWPDQVPCPQRNQTSRKEVERHCKRKRKSNEGMNTYVESEKLARGNTLR